LTGIHTGFTKHPAKPIAAKPMVHALTNQGTAFCKNLGILEELAANLHKLVQVKIDIDFRLCL
jgi:hypothetical protein